MKTRTLVVESLENRLLFSVDVDFTYYDAAERYETIDFSGGSNDVSYRADAAYDDGGSRINHTRSADSGVSLQGMAIGQATAYISVEAVVLGADVNARTYSREVTASGEIRHATAEVVIVGSGVASFKGSVHAWTQGVSDVTCCGVHELTHETEMAHGQFFVVVWGNDWQIALNATAGRDNWNDLRLRIPGATLTPVYAERAVAQFESHLEANFYYGMMMTSNDAGFTYSWDYGTDVGSSEHFARNVSMVIAQGTGLWDTHYSSEAPHFLQNSPVYARANWLQSSAEVTFSQPPAIVSGWLSSTTTDSDYGSTGQSWHLGQGNFQTYSTDAYGLGYTGGRYRVYDEVFYEVDELLTGLFY